MDFEVLPGPSLAELARTAVASAPAAIVAPGRPPRTASPGLPPGAARSPGLLPHARGPPLGGPGQGGRAGPAAAVVMRAGPAGQPVLLPADGSPTDRWLAGRPGSLR